MRNWSIEMPAPDGGTPWTEEELKILKQVWVPRLLMGHKRIDIIRDLIPKLNRSHGSIRGRGDRLLSEMRMKK